jgi:hypothetical protein
MKVTQYMQHEMEVTHNVTKHVLNYNPAHIAWDYKNTWQTKHGKEVTCTHTMEYSYEINSTFGME